MACGHGGANENGCHFVFSKILPLFSIHPTLFSIQHFSIQPYSFFHPLSLFFHPSYFFFHPSSDGKILGACSEIHPRLRVFLSLGTFPPPPRPPAPGPRPACRPGPPSAAWIAPAQFPHPPLVIIPSTLLKFPSTPRYYSIDPTKIPIYPRYFSIDST